MKKNKYEDLKRELKESFPDCNFYIKEDDNVVILYDNKKYMNDDDFLDKIIDISSKFLSDDELWNLVTNYDILNEMNKAIVRSKKETLELQIEIKNLEILQSLEKYNLPYNDFLRLSYSKKKIREKSIVATIKDGIFNKISFFKNVFEVPSSSNNTNSNTLIENPQYGRIIKRTI